MNSYFLDASPNGTGGIAVNGEKFYRAFGVKRASILRPTDCLVVADSQPKPDGNSSGSLWWPNACMNQYGTTFEGVETKRHGGQGVCGFADGHAEARKDDQINPQRNPPDPLCLPNTKYWDTQGRDQ